MKEVVLAMAMFFYAISMVGLSGNDCSAAATSDAAWQQLPAEKKKITINNDYYFIYRFDKKPKLGMVVLKIQVFDAAGNQKTPFSIRGSYDMPEMRGAHASGERKFVLNRKGDYLLPVQIVMPGEWEINMTFADENKAVFRGRIKINV